MRFVARFYRDGQRVARDVKVQATSYPRAFALAQATAIRMDGDAGLPPTTFKIIQVTTR